jgi:hypothetical protein
MYKHQRQYRTHFYTAAWRWFRDGRLPVRAERIAIGTVIVHEVIIHEEEAPAAAAAALYARVARDEQKAHSSAEIPSECYAKRLGARHGINAHGFRNPLSFRRAEFVG